MKNIKELGLELIEFEDQFLLVDPNEASQEGDWIYWNKRPVRAIDTTYSKDTKYIIASTKPLQKLPLLVIEDEVEKIAKEYTEKRNYLTEEEQGFIDGYNHAKSTYKFTEEDLRKAYDQGKHGGSTQIHLEFDEFIQSLTKKELWIEVENYCGSPYTTERCPKCIDSCDRAYERPKITNNKIHAVWK
jgi:hypothetical protein